jgi:DNA-binding transcriptional MerR regulator
MSGSASVPLTLPQLASAANVEYRTLHTWLKRGLIEPSIQTSTGTGRPNLFSEEDALRVRILADLRRAGVDLDVLQAAADGLRRRRSKLAGQEVVVINGHVAVYDDDRQLAKAFDRPEPTLVYRVSWAREALKASAPT